MKVEIWSDIACPFCYIGKRNFETALEQFAHRDQTEVIWKSYQLDDTRPRTTTENVYEMLAKRKGVSLEHAKQMNDHVVQMAKGVGLTYHMDKVIPVNTFDGHRLIQLAKKYQLADMAEEKLFQAYFVEGQNIADTDVLIAIGRELGIPETEVMDMLHSDAMVSQVREDIDAARKNHVQGVPFFRINETHSVFGAQPVTTFLEMLQKAHSESLLERK